MKNDLSYPLSEKELKRLSLGTVTKKLFDLHVQDPKRYTAEFILNELFIYYSNLQLDMEEKY
ncbi:hypothetical protein PH210_28585 [Paenibacillus sp. BSR1-1]|uniref:hypothetical protein n=1 Tax=Paenibacillus sp. BSR1-1 TaxID=3020845 RepID=UPI0025AF5011|nr:hypothetical protein [Paenibacillus sp. BSR1-1]MDN3020103.1 hypothetical protein [Paenibacillus sp. BSR1-1]